MATLLIINRCNSPDLTDIYQADQKYGRVRMPFGGLQKWESTLSLLFQLSVVGENKTEFLLACVRTLDTEKHCESRAEEAAPNSIQAEQLSRLCRPAAQHVSVSCCSRFFIQWFVVYLQFELDT